LTKAELQWLPTLARGAALRFLTRTYCLAPTLARW
jgi:hypothetical protein